MKMTPRIMLGLVEDVIIHADKETEVKAKIDTGATYSSIDIRFAAKLKLGPITDTIRIKNANGMNLRPVILTKITIKGKEFEAKFSLADRSNLKYKMLIGVDILKRGFQIDPAEKA